MKPKVYIETTIISYLTSRPSRDLLVAAHQQVTRDWWDLCRPSYVPCRAKPLRQGLSVADLSNAPSLASDVLQELESIPAGKKCRELVRELATAKVLPLVTTDCLRHLAAAMVNRVEFFLTWKHFGSPTQTMRRLPDFAERLGYACPVICTPERLIPPEADWPEDPIVAEVRAARKAFAEGHNFDLDAMFTAWKKREVTDRCKRVSPPPKRVTPARSK